jgi:4-amino-4-deoxy-L-arabinose transferase-like glycosyltransferase
MALLVGFLLLPLGDILTYPDRVSVLPNLQTDAAAYYALGRELADTKSVAALPPRHPPGWITTLGLAFLVGGTSYVTGKLVLWAALVFCVLGSAWLAGRMFGRPAKWAAALVCASSPAMRGYVGTVQYEVFTGALLLGVVALGVRTIDAPDRTALYRRAVATGLVGALLILTRETFAVVVPLLAGWVATCVRRRMGRQPALGAAVLVTAVAMAPAIGWTVVQSARFEQLITISEKGPIVIELGNNPRANGTYNAPLVGIGQPTGLRFVLENPGRSVVLAVRKVLYFWGVLRDGWNVPRPAAVWLWRASTGLVPLEWFAALARGGWLLLLFAVALWQLDREGLARWWGVPGAVLTIMIVHIVTLSSHRFAVTTLPLVFALVSGPLARLTQMAAVSLRSAVVKSAALGLLVIVVAMQFQSWPLRRQLEAALLDGLNADNVVDKVAGREVRIADAARGVRPMVLLADEYFPRGTVRLSVRARRLQEAPSAVPALHVSIVDLAGQPACAREFAAGELRPDAFDALVVMCPIVRDTVATLAVTTLGAVDVAIDELSLDWVRPR